MCSVDKDIIVRLKWNATEYKGRLVSIDSYMNIQLRDTEEFIDSKPTGTLGQVLIRYDALKRVFSSIRGAYVAFEQRMLTQVQMQQRALDPRS